jgi:hypothetical protein
MSLCLAGLARTPLAQRVATRDPRIETDESSRPADGLVSQNKVRGNEADGS